MADGIELTTGQLEALTDISKEREPPHPATLGRGIAHRRRRLRHHDRRQPWTPRDPDGHVTDIGETLPGG